MRPGILAVDGSVITPGYYVHWAFGDGKPMPLKSPFRTSQSAQYWAAIKRRTGYPVFSVVHVKAK